MDPTSIDQIISSAAGLAQTAWKVCKIIASIKDVDKTISALSVEVKQVSNIFLLVTEKVKLVSDDKALLQAINNQITICLKPIETIQAKLQLGEPNIVNGVFRQQLKLDMEETEINRCRNQIQDSISNIQVSLLLVNIQAIYLKPRRADEDLLASLNMIETILNSQNIEENMRQCAANIVSSGNSLHDENTRRSTIDTNERRVSAVNEWLDDVTVSGETNRSTTILTPQTSLLADLSGIATSAIGYDSDDSLDVEVADATLRIGIEAFKANQFAKAEASLYETLKSIKVLSESQQRNYNPEEIHLYLAICAFHLHDSDKAQEMLINAIDQEMRAADKTGLKAEGLKCLVLIYLKTNKLDLAVSTCKILYKEQKKLFGKGDKSYPSLAFLAKIHELSNNQALASAYWSMVPVEFQDKLREETKDLGLSQDRNINVTEGTGLTWKTLEVGGTVSEVECAPDNSLLALAVLRSGHERQRTIQLRTLSSGELYRVLELDSDIAPSRLRFDPQARKIAATVFLKTPSRNAIIIWSVESGQILIQIPFDGTRPRTHCLAFSPSGDQLFYTKRMFTNDDNAIGHWTHQIIELSNSNVKTLPTGFAANNAIWTHDCLVANYNGGWYVLSPPGYPTTEALSSVRGFGSDVGIGLLDGSIALLTKTQVVKCKNGHVSYKDLVLSDGSFSGGSSKMAVNKDNQIIVACKEFRRGTIWLEIPELKQGKFVDHYKGFDDAYQLTLGGFSADGEHVFFTSSTPNGDNHILSTAKVKDLLGSV